MALALAAATASVGVLGCGGSPTAPEGDQVFYLQSGRGVIDKNYSWERYFPPLDRESTPRLTRRVGVAVLDGDVRFSRPIDWYLRTADYTPERRLISYQSPRQFVFTIYEKTDPTGVPWGVLLQKYEKDVSKSGSKIISARVPLATANSQGRSYLIKTMVPSRPEDYETFAHEVIVRSRKRILLVQIVHDRNVEPALDEVVDVLRSMLVY